MQKMFIIIIIVIALLGARCDFVSERIVSQNTSEQQQILVTLQIFGSQALIYHIVVSSDATVVDVLQQAQYQGLQMETTSFGNFGLYVRSMNGLSENSKNQMYWVYEINGVKAAQGISTQIVHSNDIIIWKYEHAY